VDWAKGLSRALMLRNKPLTLAMVHPFSGHNFELRYWLAAGGVHPDQHVRIVAIPPPLMVESLAAGHVDGFCVGEPWNSLAVERGIGRIVATKAQLIPRGIEKVLAIRLALAADRARLHALLEALSAAAAWVDEPRHREEAAAMLSRREYLDIPAALIARSLAGKLELGNGEVLDEPDFLYFARHDASFPATREALWIYAQMLRWGQLPARADLRERAAAVFRPDLFMQALGSRETTVAPALGAFDRIEFSTRDIEGYLEQFDLYTPFVDARSVL
jgi:NitT/TauT family transport system ATP-binding protein